MSPSAFWVEYMADGPWEPTGELFKPLSPSAFWVEYMADGPWEPTGELFSKPAPSQLESLSYGCGHMWLSLLIKEKMALPANSLLSLITLTFVNQRGS